MSTIKEIEGYSNYLISSDGYVLNTKFHNTKETQMLKPFIIKLYYNVRLSKLGKAKNKRIHRLVASHFIPNPLNKPCVNHINGNKLDNRMENLEWVTIKENDKHAWKTGLRKATYGSRRLTDVQVKEIRYKLSLGIKQESISKEYGVDATTICNINTKKTWGNIQ